MVKCYTEQADELIINEKRCHKTPGCELIYTINNQPCSENPSQDCTWIDPTLGPFLCKAKGTYNITGYECIIDPAPVEE